MMVHHCSSLIIKVLPLTERTHHRHTRAQPAIDPSHESGAGQVWGCQVQPPREAAGWGAAVLRSMSQAVAQNVLPVANMPRGLAFPKVHFGGFA
eukprot:363497-Chlamydomonas_euryale.AAC.3